MYYICGQNMKEMELTRGFRAQVDDEDYEYLTQNFGKFQYVPNHNSGYAAVTVRMCDVKKLIKMHHLIITRYEPIPIGYEVDHIDHNPLNNQRDNLRVVTHRDNCNNRKTRRNPICSRCNEREKYGWYSYCLPCFLEYMKERRKNNPELRQKATEYKRAYRKLKKEQKWK